MMNITLILAVLLTLGFEAARSINSQTIWEQQRDILRAQMQAESAKKKKFKILDEERTLEARNAYLTEMKMKAEALPELKRRRYLEEVMANASMPKKKYDYQTTDEVLAGVLLEKSLEIDEDDEEHEEVIANIIEFYLDDCSIKLNLTLTMKGMVFIDYKKKDGEHWSIYQDVADNVAFNYTNTEARTFEQPSMQRSNFSVQALVNSTEDADALSAAPLDPWDLQFLTDRNCCFIKNVHNHIPERNILKFPEIGMISNLFSTHQEFEVHDDHGGASYDYELHGDDWPASFETCAEDQQSPINLLSPVTKYGNSYKFHMFEDDNSKLEYVTMTDVPLLSFPDIHTVEMYLDHKDGYLGFTSHLGSQIWGATSEWQTYEIQYKHRSEHTVEGHRYDAELQLFHFPKLKTAADETDILAQSSSTSMKGRRNLASSGLFGEQEEGAGEDHFTLITEKLITFDFAIIAMLFDSKLYDPSFTDAEIQWFYDFFDNLLFEYHLPTIEKFPLDELMARMDMSNRWIYKGSMTTPDCHRYVYWNVLERIYPIREDQLELLKKKLEIVGVGFNDGLGNNRAIQTKFNKEVFFVKSGALLVQAAGLASLATFTIMTLF